MQQQLIAISAIGEDKPGIVNEISNAITNGGGNIMDSRMTVLGGEFALIMLVDSVEEDVAQIQANLNEAKTSLGLELMLKLTRPKDKSLNCIAYRVAVLSMDHPGIMRHVTDFFSRAGINIEKLESSHYAAAHTGTPMFAMTMAIAVPADMKIAALKQRFLELCDELNVDGDFEAVKQ